MLQSGGQYFFLPAGRTTTAEGTALVFPRTDSLRLEFGAAGPARPDRCASSP